MRVNLFLAAGVLLVVVMFTASFFAFVAPESHLASVSIIDADSVTTREDGAQIGAHGGVYNPEKAKKSVLEIKETVHKLASLLESNDLAALRTVYKSLPTFCPNWRIAGVDGKEMQDIADRAQLALNAEAEKNHAGIKRKTEDEKDGSKEEEESGEDEMGPVGRLFNDGDCSGHEGDNAVNPDGFTTNDEVEPGFAEPEEAANKQELGILSKDARKFVQDIAAMQEHSAKGNYDEARQVYSNLLAVDQSKFHLDAADIENMQKSVDDVRTTIHKNQEDDPDLDRLIIKGYVEKKKGGDHDNVVVVKEKQSSKKEEDADQGEEETKHVSKSKSHHDEETDSEKKEHAHDKKKVDAQAKSAKHEKKKAKEEEEKEEKEEEEEEEEEQQDKEEEQEEEEAAVELKKENKVAAAADKKSSKKLGRKAPKIEKAKKEDAEEEEANE